MRLKVQFTWTHDGIKEEIVGTVVSWLWGRTANGGCPVAVILNEKDKILHWRSFNDVHYHSSDDTMADMMQWMLKGQIGDEEFARIAEKMS